MRAGIISLTCEAAPVFLGGASLHYWTSIGSNDSAVVTREHALPDDFDNDILPSREFVYRLRESSEEVN